jgi:hypothetical protein
VAQPTSQPVKSDQPISQPPPKIELFSKPTQPIKSEQPQAKTAESEQPASRPTTRPALGDDGKLSAAMFAQIALCVLRWSGDYNMFDPSRERVDIGKQREMIDGKGVKPSSLGQSRLGVYVGGFQTLRHDLGIAECIGRITRTHKRSFFDLKPLADLAGIPIYAPRQGSDHHSDKVNYYNPEFIKWATANLIPDPNAQIFNITYQQVYNVVFARFIRITTQVYKYLQQEGRFALYLDRYKNADFRQRKQIRSEFRKLIEDEYIKNLYGLPDYHYHAGHAVTFWMRRGMDDTHLLVWQYIETLLAKYDPQFLAELQKADAAQSRPTTQPTTQPIVTTITLTPKEASLLPKLLDTAVPNTIILLKPGIYSYPLGLQIFRKRNLTLKGTGPKPSWIIIDNLYDDVISIKYSNNINIRNISAKHLTPSRTFKCEGAVIDITRSSFVWIDRSDLNGSGAVGVRIDRGFEVIISNNYIYNNSLAAIMVIRGDYIAIENNEITHNNSTLYTLGKNTIRMSNNRIKNNQGDAPWSTPFTRRILGH